MGSAIALMIGGSIGVALLCGFLYYKKHFLDEKEDDKKY